MGICVGIDLGTCYSSIAYVDPYTKEISLLVNGEGSLKTPTCMVALSGGTFLFGQEALDKKLTGEGDALPPFQDILMNEEYSLQCGATTYDAISLTAMYLNYLLEQARVVVKEDITEAVITVPSFFGDGERRRIKEALAMTGVYVAGILNDTTASAITYCHKNPQSKSRLLIYKLGGGNFEATVVETDMGNVRVLGSTGTTDLGGREWEQGIAAYVQSQFVKEFSEDYSEDLVESLKVQILVEQIKIRLSQVSSAEATIHYKDNTGSYTVTRDMYRQMSETLLEMTLRMVKELLHNLHLAPSWLDGILFSGGGAKMSIVREYICEELDCKSIAGVSPDYDVVYGAAIKGMMTQVSPLMLLKEPKVFEVVNHSLGMISVSLDGAWYVNSIIIQKNARIPVSNTRTFRLTVPEMGGKMVIYLLQGEAATPKDCQVIGKYVIEQIAYEEGGTTFIEITYTYDENAIIHINARQKGSEEALPIHTEHIPADMDWVSKKPELPLDFVSVKREGIIYLCLDLSGSMAGTPLMEVKKAVRRLLEKVDLEERKVSIIGFADHSQQVLPPTKDSKQIERILQRLHVSGRLFGYGNGVSPFAMIYEQCCKQDVPTKEEVCMVVLTDGAWPDQERVLEIASHLKKKGIMIYTMAFGRADTEYLARLASSTEFSDFLKKKKPGEWLSIAQVVSQEETK